MKKTKSQKERVLQMLQKAKKKGVECFRFVDVSPRIMCHTARISNLRNDGHHIECVKKWVKGIQHSTYFLY